MTIKELAHLLQHPASISEAQTDALAKISKEFPYFQSIRPILLKGLKEQGSFRYNQELKTTAAYTVDRSVLFDYITSPLFQEPTPTTSTPPKTPDQIGVIDPEEVKALARIAMDDAVDMDIQEAEKVLNPALFSSKEDIEKAVDETAITHEEATSMLAIDTPLEFDKKETHSFSEWLKITSIQPIDATNATPEEATEEATEEAIEETVETTAPPTAQQEKFELIDEFIANNPKIKPADKNSPSRNLANEHTVTPDELMTETLARVYLAQKKYKQAIQAYKILILKNPEKSGFFADQIRAIEKIHENK